MHRRFTPPLLLKAAAAMLAVLLLTPLVRPSVWSGVDWQWLLAAGLLLAAPLLVASGVALLRWLGREHDVDLAPSELTTLTFPPESRLQRPRQPQRR